MRDYITPLGGYLVIGGQLVAVFAALLLTYALAYRRGERDERAKQDAARERRVARIMRAVRCAPSSATLYVWADDTAAVADMLIEDAGCLPPRVVEEG